tara:strand:+ start:454 stop:2070 length:1617 start_codon:yes stop_codon:yes gene_type:complete
MIWLYISIAVIVIVISIVVLNRYYRKATREVALVRTGAGGQRVIIERGFLAFPFLHKVSEVNMKTSKLEIERLGPKSIITADRLRVDLGAEFYVRVAPNVEGVQTAAQALGGKSFRTADLGETLEGKFVDALMTVGAKYTMDNLQDKRGEYSREVSEIVTVELAKNGLLLETVAITRLDQTPFHALDENNAFNAVGMRQLSEVISTNKKERAAIEAEAEVSVAQTQLDATKRKLTISQEEEEASIGQQKAIETARALSMAEIAEQQANSETRRDEARIARELEISKSENAKDQELNRARLAKELALESSKYENSVKLSEKRIEDIRSQIEVRQIEANEVLAAEEVSTKREKEVAKREKDIALIRAAEQAEVDTLRVASEAETVLSMAKAKADATRLRSDSEKGDMLAKAAGKSAIIAAENAQSKAVIDMKLSRKKLEILPEVVEKMMKPAEKIEGIRINNISGFSKSGGSDGSGSSEGSSVNNVIDGVLDLALQLPAVKKIGEEVGLNVSEGLKGISESLDNTVPSKETKENTKENKD